MILRDYECPECGETREELVDSLEEPVVCEKCGGLMLRIVAGTCAKTLTTIVPSYKGCLKHRAGYVHLHGDKPATKVQGCGFGEGQRSK